MAGLIVALDAYGPVTDNAQSVFELSQIEGRPGEAHASSGDPFNIDFQGNVYFTSARSLGQPAREIGRLLHHDPARQDLLQHQKAGHVLVVTHAGVIRMMLSHALALDPRYAYRLAVSNAALTRIRVECEDGVRLPTLLFHDGRLQEKS